MRSKYVNSTSSRKFLTGNGFSDIDFLYSVKILAARGCFSLILVIFFTAHARFDHTNITTSGLKSNVIFEFCAPGRVVFWVK